MADANRIADGADDSRDDPPEAYLNRIIDRLLACRNLPEAGSIQLFPHVGIDGDALGSCLALLLVLRKIGLAAHLLLDEPVPERLKFMPALDLLEPFDETRIDDYAADQKMALVVDCSESGRVGRRQVLLEQAPLLAVLDHHVSFSECGPLRCVDTTAAAAGEIVFDLIRLIEARLLADLIDHPVATLLMTAIISDTGGFVFSNTSARTFRTAASLMAYEISLREITYQLFDMTSQAKFRLMGRLFNEAHFSLQGRLAVAAVDLGLLEETGATDGDLEGVVNHLRNVAGVKVAILIREQKDGSLRVNIRSDEHFNAAAFAARFGGGGHARAAGLQLAGPSVAEAAAMLADKAGEWL